MRVLTAQSNGSKFSPDKIQIQPSFDLEMFSTIKLYTLNDLAPNASNFLSFFMYCSIHNYVSLNGEFYCVSHYQQLCKKKGNYEDAIGLKQRKDQRLHLNQGTEETDSASTPKLIKDSLKKSQSFKDYSTKVEKTVTKALQSIQCAEATGKLKLDWPPKKKSSEFESVQRTNIKRSLSDIRRESTNDQRVSNNNALKLDSGGAVDKVKALANCFQLGEENISKTGRLNLTAEKFSPERPKPRSDKAFLFIDRATTVTSDDKETKKPVRISANMDNDTSKAKKFVHFAQDINDNKPGVSPTFTAKLKTEEQKEQHRTSKPKDLRNVHDKNNLSVHVERETRQSKLHAETTEPKLQEQIITPVKNSQCEVDSERIIPKTDAVNENRGTDTNGVQSDPTNKVLNGQEPQDHIKGTETKNPTALHRFATKTNKENTNSISNHLKKVETVNAQVKGGSQRKLLTKTNFVKVSANPEEKNNVRVGTRSAGINALSKLFTSGGNDKSSKPETKDGKKTGGGLLGRLLSSSEKESPKNAKQNEKNDKTETIDSKSTESQETASTDTLLQEQRPQIQSQKQKGTRQIGGQSSLKQGSEQETVEMSRALPQEYKTSEQLVPQEQPTQREMFKNSNVPSLEERADEQTVEESEVLSLEQGSFQQVVEMSEVAPQESKEQIKGKSLLSPPEEKECEDQTVKISQEKILKEKPTEFQAPDSDSEPSSVPSSPINERQERQSVIQQTGEPVQNGHESNLQYTDGADLGLAEVPGVNQELVESADQSGRDGLSIEWNSDSFKGNEESGLIDPDTSHLKGDEFGGKTGEFLDAANMEGAQFSNEVLFDSSHQPLDHFSHNLGLLESQETTMDGFSSPLSGTAFGMVDVPSNQDEVHSSSPFGPSEHPQNGPDLDIFGLSNSPITQSPSVDVSGEAFNQPSAFTGDILGDALSCTQDVSILAPSDPSTSNSLSDLFGPDASFSAPPSVRADPFADDFFETAPQLQPMSQSSDMSLFMDSLLVPDNSSTKTAAENAASSNSWMDDLLG